jgi:predicted metal-dependent phosphoesterase TrpH
MNYDLHSHTLASDGSLTPDALVAAAVDAGVDTLAITDHDTVAGYLEWASGANKLAIEVIPGIEFSTTWNGIGIHVLGLNIDPHSAAIQTGSKIQISARCERAVRIIERLKKAGLPVDQDALLASAGTDAPGRPHIARYLVDNGLVKDINTAFKKYLGAGKAGDVKNLWAEMKTVVDWIRDSGGTAVLAHPDKYNLTFSKLTRLTDDFAALGGQGIEVISGQQHPDTTQRLARLCSERKLVASKGSDFHQPGQPWSRLGTSGPLPEQCTPVWHHW